jgi:hypothetical protein
MAETRKFLDPCCFNWLRTAISDSKLRVENVALSHMADQIRTRIRNKKRTNKQFRNGEVEVSRQGKFAARPKRPTSFHAFQPADSRRTTSRSTPTCTAYTVHAYAWRICVPVPMVDASFWLDQYTVRLYLHAPRTEHSCFYVNGIVSQGSIILVARFS